MTPRPRKVICWYVCELVHECVIDGLKSRFVWVNIHMIKAGNANEAYAKAKRLGQKHNRTYRAGPKGKRAQWRFRGIRNLVHFTDAEPSDGCELMFETFPRMSASGVKRLLTPKRRLSAFR